jgi:acyl-CoA reductase-like NAD-dependent aldehyde dehydrogenase
LQGPFETRLFINNEFVNAVGGKTFPTVNPATEEVIAHMQEGTAEDINLAVAAARAAFEGPAWSKINATARRDYILKVL